MALCWTPFPSRQHPRLLTQGTYEEARRLYERSLAIREKALSPDHLDVAASISKLAGLLQSQVSVEPLEVWSVLRSLIWFACGCKATVVRRVSNGHNAPAVYAG